MDYPIVTKVINLEKIHVQIISLLDNIHMFKFILSPLPKRAGKGLDLDNRIAAHRKALKFISEQEIKEKFINTFEPFWEISFGKAELQHLLSHDYIEMNYAENRPSLNHYIFLPDNSFFQQIEIGRKIWNCWIIGLQHAERTGRGRHIAGELRRKTLVI